MTSLDRARAFALSLPEVAEEDHHGMPSFRVRGKIFATVPDREHLHIMLVGDEIEMAVATARAAYEKLWWGKRLAGLRVTLAAAETRLLCDLLTEAWRLKAPRKLSASYDLTAQRRPTRRGSGT